MTNDDLTKQEVSQLATLLSRLKPGLLPFDVFHVLTRVLVMPIVELVPLRTTQDGKVEVLLVQREADDPIWPGEWHVSGTVVRATDVSFSDAISRIRTSELANTDIAEPVFVKSVLHNSGRGMEASQIFWAEVQSEPTTGTFYDADNLPDSVVKSQLDFIPAAVTHFKAQKSS